MRALQFILRGCLVLTVLACVSPTGRVAARQASGELEGQVVDELGGVVVGAVVTLANADGAVGTKSTDSQGGFVFTGLRPGSYSVSVAARSFTEYVNAEVEVKATARTRMNVRLTVALENVDITVRNETAVSTAQENGASALLLSGAALDALPDDPDELAAALRALAGPSAGIDGGQIFVDNLTDIRLPPKSSIREIRVNANPFSAEFARLGYGRVEIFTKPGTDKLHGQASFNFSNEHLNSRNPFASNRPPYQFMLFSGTLGGPLVAKRASYFLDFEHRHITDNSIVNATVLDPSLSVTTFGLAVRTPQRRTTFSPRLDYQLNPKNTLTARYTLLRLSFENAGVGNFSLPSRAYDTSATEQSAQLSENAVLSTRLLNEVRFQYLHRRNRQRGDDSVPTVNVLDAFTGGGAPLGLASTDEDRIELQDYMTVALGTHTLRTGVRLRHVNIGDLSPLNFAGTFTFVGGLAPALDASDRIVTDSSGNPVLTQVTSIERYRRTLLFQGRGLTPEQIRALGGGATQFSRVGGDPRATLGQTEFSLFLQDQWNVRPNLTLGLGLRYDFQKDVHSPLNFAPRLAIAYAPRTSASGKQATVIRAGFGIFYDRLAESLRLQAAHLGGEGSRQFVTDDPNLLNLFPAVPSLEALAASSDSLTTVHIAPDLRLPYMIQSAVGVERQLPWRFVVAATFLNSRGLHLLRSRNVNAPLPGTGVRPLGDALGNVFQYESSGRFNQNQLIVNLKNPVSSRYSVFATYALNSARGDTDGAGTFPADSYDLSGEYGRSAFDVRHRLDLGGVFTWRRGVSLNPFVLAASGQPFNIITGRDANGDTLFTERPSFATDSAQPGVVATRFGTFQTNPRPGERLIPRNYGTSPAFFTVNLRVSKVWGFGGGPRRPAPAPQSKRGGTGGVAGTGSVLPNSNRTDFTGKSSESRYKLTLSVIARNIFNRTNPGRPVGNLNSLLFGRSNFLAPPYGFGELTESNAANRRIEAQLRFSF